jgi:hypothetical protein
VLESAERCPRQIEVVLNFAPDDIDAGDPTLNVTEYLPCTLPLGHQGPCCAVSAEEIAVLRALFWA